MHPAAVSHVRMDDLVVPDRELVVVVVIAVENQHNRAPEVVHAEGGEVEQIGRHDDAGRKPPVTRNQTPAAAAPDQLENTTLVY